MYDKAKVGRINALVQTIEDAEQKLNAELGGEGLKQRAPQKCGNCGEAGHTKATCTRPKQEGSPA
jgi:hypothetical protein